MAQRVKHLPAMWKTWVLSLGWEDPLEKEMATHSSILAWRIPWTEEPGRLQSTDSQSRTRLSNFTLNMLSRLIIAFLPRSKCLNFVASVTICSDCGAQENKVCHCFHYFPIYLPWSDETRCYDLSFLNVDLSQFFYSPLSLSSRGSLVPLHVLP